jgi:hypothetical protein
MKQKSTSAYSRKVSIWVPSASHTRGSYSYFQSIQSLLKHTHTHTKQTNQHNRKATEKKEIKKKKQCSHHTSASIL